MSAWIEYAPEDGANEKLAEALELAKTPHGTVDNVMRAHSLRPSTMIGHIHLYRAVLHDDGNRIPGWLQETVGSFVSSLNGCSYSFDNHWSNAKHLIDDPERATKIEQAIRERNPSLAFSGAELAMMNYAEKLAMRPSEMNQSDVQALRDKGLDDGRILEIVQIVGYFSYANRHLNGLGVSTEGDVVGYYVDSDGNEDAATEGS